MNLRSKCFGKNLAEFAHVFDTAITRDMVQTRHLQLSANHPARANLTMRILRALFKYAMYEDSDGRPVITINPVDRLKLPDFGTKLLVGNLSFVRRNSSPGTKQ
ncbi:MAG: hypothetical protein K2X77_22765 [Candidatus Obscuribacterales bacterium]|nr:hypothetical protein [Candidatus Obscuribacterales bacterium]